MSQILQNVVKFQKFELENLLDFEKMLQNAYFLAKIGADTAENERNFAEILSKTGNPNAVGVLVGRSGRTGSAAASCRA